MSETLRALKARNELRLEGEKRSVDRKRNLLTLTARYLQDNGYLQSAETLQGEAGVSLSKWDAADNIDLLGIMIDYEDAYRVKFGRGVKLVRKVSSSSSSSSSSSETLASQKRRRAKEDARRRRNDRNSYKGHEGRGGVDGHTSTALMGVTGKLATGRAAPPPGAASNSDSTGTTSAAASADGTAATVPRPPDSLGAGVSGARVGLTAGPSSAALAGGGGAAARHSSNRSSRFADAQDHERRLLKPLPYSDPDTRALAGAITRDIYRHNPGVRWDDIVELDAAKRLLKEAVVMPIRYPELFTGLLTPWKGVLLFGPPGTGKTMLARAVATECSTTFFNISASSIVSKYRGDSEKLVRVLFELARYHAPSTVFLDEIDSIMAQRGQGGEHEASRRMKTELLIQMDGLARSDDLVFVLAASNVPWALDGAMLRRLEKRILVPLPGEQAREVMFRKMFGTAAGERGGSGTGGGSGAGKDEDVEGKRESSANRVRVDGAVDFGDLAARSEGYSGADIRLIVKEAAMRPLRRMMSSLESLDDDLGSGGGGGSTAETLLAKLGPVDVGDLDAALRVTKPSSGFKSELYTKWQEEHGSS